MEKLIILTDSNSGITNDLAKELGVKVVPMPFNINGREYFEDVNLSQEQFYEMVKEGVDISTSQPAVGSLLELWDKLLEEYEEILYIPMSSGLSGSCQTATMLASEDYEDKVFVVNNQRIAITLQQSVLDAITLAKKGKTAKEIKQILEDTKFDSSIYITVDSLWYLKRGGRITTTAAAIGSVLNLKPVLQIQGEKLDAYSKARGMKQAKKVMLTAMQNDIKNRFSDLYEKGELGLFVAHSKNEDMAKELKKEIEELLPNCKVAIQTLSLSISCHIGPGALAVAMARIIK